MKLTILTLIAVTSITYFLMVLNDYQREVNVQKALYKACTAELQWTLIKLEQS